jgi:hypothetical protein
MSDKERLIKLLADLRFLGGCERQIADHLIKNGVIFAKDEQIKEYRSFLYKIYNELYPSQLQVECIRVTIERFLERMENKHDGT